MPGWIQVIAGPILGAIVGGLAGWLQLEYGVVIGQEDRDKLVASAMTLAAIFGAIAKRGFDSWMNPTNASSPTVAKAEKEAVKTFGPDAAAEGSAAIASAANPPK